MDRFLSKMGVPKLKLQLLGITCLMVASKMLDTIPPDTIQMMELTDKTYSAVQVRKMELMLLEVSFGKKSKKNFDQRNFFIFF